MKRLTGKIAIITGAASGIGLATAKLFIENGARVIITDRDRDAGVKACKELSGAVQFFEQDVTNSDSWPQLFQFCKETTGQPTIMVNNAGILGYGDSQTLATTDLDHWRAVQSVNVEAVFLSCQTAVEEMKESGGSIVNLSSVASKRATPDLIAYGASKAAVAHLTKSVAAHCKRMKYNIRCNSIHPNPIKTAMGDQLMSQIGGDAERGWEIFEKSRMNGRAGEPEDVAQAVLFLASDDAKHINGAELAVDDGMSAF
ncbi:MAG: glucose 1-dehydrogenase [Sneathiella sp.]